MLDIYYMIVHIVPQMVYTVIIEQDFRYLNIKFSDNLLLKLSPKLLTKWLSYNRLGTFSFDSELNPTFQPGIVRPDIYCPILESFPIFELAVLLHEINIINHADFINECMTHRTRFVKIFKEHITISSHAVSGLFQSERTYRDILCKAKIRVKRKLRFSISKNIQDVDFLNFLTKKGHTKWCVLN